MTRLVHILLIGTLAAVCASSTPLTNSDADAPTEVTLQQIDRQSKSGRFGLPPLTGVNKPGDLALRYRKVVPPETPSYVPRRRNDMDLFIADPTPDGWLAFYKGACGDLGDVCDYEASLYDENGTSVWQVDLNTSLSGSRYLEIQDIRYQDGDLYFNEACATYAREADGACSSLIRLNPRTEQVEWRTRPLTSNTIFILHDPYVISGYGFTNEPDSLFLIEQQSGRTVARTGLDTAHEYLEMQDDRLYVITYNSVYTFAIQESTQ